MEQYKLYQRGTKEATVTYSPESHDVPYIVRMYDGETLIDKMRTDSKTYATEIAMRWIDSK